MARKETIQSQGAPSEWESLSPTNWKWLDDLRLLIQGREGRQNFINTLTDTKTNNVNIRTFFVNDGQANAYFTANDGAVDPYIGSGGELIVPVSIIAGEITVGRRNVLNIGAVKAYQTSAQTFTTGTPTTLTYNATAFDEDGTMVLASGVMTPTYAGKYSVSAAVGFDSTQIVADKAFSIAIVKNGATITAAAEAHTSNALYPNVICVSDLVEMNGTTDTLRVVVQQDFGANANTIGAQYAGYFTAFKAN